MGEKPFIQYQGDSILCEEVAMNVFKKLEYLYNYSGQVKKRKASNPSEGDEEKDGGGSAR